MAPFGSSSSYKGPWYCYYEFKYKLIYSGSVLLGAILFCALSLKLGCSKTKDIERVFIMGNFHQNYVDVANLMSSPGQYNAGAGPQNQPYMAQGQHSLAGYQAPQQNPVYGKTPFDNNGL